MVWRGMILDRMGRYEEALEDMDKAIELDPDNDIYHQWYNDILNVGAAIPL